MKWAPTSCTKVVFIPQAEWSSRQPQSPQPSAQQLCSSSLPNSLMFLSFLSVFTETLVHTWQFSRAVQTV